MSDAASELAQLDIPGGRIGAVHARMGVIISSSNRMVEPQLKHFGPPGLGIHITRMRMSTHRKRSMPEQMDIILGAAQLLADAKVDVIVLQASGFAMEKGPAAEDKVVQAITQATSTPALTSTQAMVEAIRLLGLRRLVLISPFNRATNAFEKTYLEALGFEVTADLGLSLEPDESIQVTPARWLKIVKENARPEADGYFLSGSNTTMTEAIPLIERDLGKPAVSSSQATLWAGLRRLSSKLGAMSPPPGLGRLMTYV
jgi:maleate isomerase